MAEYSNILSAVSAQPKDYNRLNDNYRLFNELQSKGMSLADVIKRAESADDLKRQVDELERKAVTSTDTASFKAMESAVKDDPDVQDAKKGLQEIRSQIITELCAADPRYRDASERYHNTVNDAYVKRKEE